MTPDNDDLWLIGDKGRAMPSARAATPSGLSRFASSCQYRIAIASVTVAAFTATWFAAHLISAAGQM